MKIEFTIFKFEHYLYLGKDGLFIEIDRVTKDKKNSYVYTLALMKVNLESEE